MAETPLPHSNFGTASLVERRDGLPPVELEEGPGAEVPVEDTAIIAAPGLNIELEEDGGVVIDFDPRPTPSGTGDFYDNLAETLSDAALGKVSSELLEQYEANKDGRKEWEDTYRTGLELLGFKYEERSEPFRGATGVTHPLLAEAVTQFQAQAFGELLPSGGPVRTEIIGKSTPEAEDQAERVRHFMNYQITCVMKEYTPEFDQMLFHLPLSGSTFKKVYYDEFLGRAVSRFVPAEQLVIPYMATDLETAENVTHVIQISENELRKKQIAGFYSDVEITPAQTDPSQVREEMDDIAGVSPNYLDQEVTLLECHVDLDLEGYEDTDEGGEPTGIKLPYVVTVSENSGKILSVRRNYHPEDEARKKNQYFVHFKFLPGFGFYGLGLIHMIGGLSRTATAALRQLIDAGTLSNLPAGFKARGLRIRDDDNPLSPGEFRDVDAPGGAIRDSLMLLPYKGADQTLFQLMGFCVEAGQRFAAVSSLQVGDANQQAPVGTTIALLEQGAKVMSAIHKRLHYAQKEEFILLADVLGQSLPPEYPYNVVGAERTIKAEDFDDRVDVVPVSDPNIFSMAQRVTLAQTELELAQSAPDLHNMYEAYRRIYQAVGVKDIDSILKPVAQEQPAPKDPAEENSEALENLPLTVFEGQNHDAHIMAHLVFGSSNMISQMPNIAMELQKHVMEHVSLKAKEQVVTQISQQLKGQPPTPEQAPQIESMVAELVAQGMQELKALSTQIAQGPNSGPDPLIALKEQDLQLRAQRDAAENQIDQGRLVLDQQKAAANEKLGADRIQSNETMVQARIRAAKERELLKQQRGG
mgnify:FL=1|jgi:hypothetical protein|tara:strand:+ start:103 stop:2538 length:2436 start_codon:yes stop_codon:yes gene_type:complete